MRCCCSPKWDSGISKRCSPWSPAIEAAPPDFLESTWRRSFANSRGVLAATQGSSVMANSGFKIIDSDMHVIEPPDLWSRYIEPRYRERAPRGIAVVPRDLRVEVDGVRMPNLTPRIGHANPRSLRALDRSFRKQAEAYAEPIARSFDAVSQLHAMDNEGLDIAVLFPSRGLFAVAMDRMEPEFAAAIASAYNDWLADFRRESPERLVGVGMIAPHDVPSAVVEAHRCVKDLGFKGIFVRPNLVNGRRFHDPEYDPLWGALEELNVPICFHEGEGPALQQVGDIFESHMMRHTCCHPMEMMLAMVSMIGGGVLERFPRLRAAFLEANCSWVPWLLWRFAQHYAWTGREEHPELKRTPVEYFRDQCFVSVECDEEPARLMAESLGDDNIVFSTDYPHPDAKYPKAVSAFLNLPLAEASMRKILWDNCARLYAL